MTQISKMAIAKAVHAELTSEEFKLPEGYKSPRGVFIDRMCEDHGMTPQGAGTYWHNLNNAARGKPLYHKPKKAGPVQGALDLQPAPEEVVEVAEVKPTRKRAAAK